VGISWFAPVLSDLNYLHDILFYRLVAAKVQSAVSVLVSEDPNGGSRPPLPGLTPVSGAKGTTTNGDRQRFLEPGLIHNVGTGKVTPFIPNPSSDLDPVTRLVLRGVAVGIGTSYELLTGDYSQVNFAGGRLVRQDSRRRNLPVHSFVCRRLEDPVHHEWCDAELAFGAMRPPRDLETLYDVRYSQPKSDEGVNPTQDASAAAQRLALGISTLREEVEARGGDWQEYLEQITSERTYGKDLGMLIHEALFVPTDTTPGESA
jgi:capsid protein